MRDYHNDHMVDYEEPEAIGFLSIPVLEFLNGKPWNEAALGFVHSLRPSCIRVTTGSIKLDSRCWRVTVVVDENDVIDEITQEVEVGLFRDEMRSGDHLRVALAYGFDSKQYAWYVDDNIEGFVYSDKFYKRLTDGTLVPFPEGK